MSLIERSYTVFLWFSLLHGLLSTDSCENCIDNKCSVNSPRNPNQLTCRHGCQKGWLLGEKRQCDTRDCTHCRGGACNDRGGCDKCARGWRMNGRRCTRRDCSQCADHTCEDASHRTCKDCVDGWLLGALKNCFLPDCTNCWNELCMAEEGDRPICTSCKPGWLLGKEKRCLERDCRHCLDNQCLNKAMLTCKVCRRGYLPGKDNRCSERVCLNCLESKCDFLTGECLKGCLPGWIPGKNGTCEERDCSHCAGGVCDVSDNVSRCKDCQIGWLPGPDGLCFQYDCSHCQGGVCMNKELGLCSECLPEWDLGVLSRCTENTCKRCLDRACDTTTGRCFACEPGWSLGPDSMCKEPNCTNCIGETCRTKGPQGEMSCRRCKPGFMLGEMKRCTVTVAEYNALQEKEKIKVKDEHKLNDYFIYFFLGCAGIAVTSIFCVLAFQQNPTQKRPEQGT